MLMAQALALAAMPLVFGDAPGSWPAHGYERYVAPWSLSEQPRLLAHVVRAFGHGHGQRFVYDWRLMQAAQELAAAHPVTLDIEQVRSRAQALGWTDGELAAVMVMSRPQALPQSLAVELGQTLSDSDVDRLGIGFSAGPAQPPKSPEATAVVLASRRLVHLGPVPSLTRLGQTVHLRGTLAHGAITALSLSLTCPDGRVVSAPLPMHQKTFAGFFATGRTAGRLQVEVLAERGRGPEVAAAFPIEVGKKPVTTKAYQEPLAPTPEGTPTPQDLLALVWGARQSHNLSLPSINERLMQAAQEHADDMAQHHFFAHVSPSSGDATQRLKALGEPYLHVVENIAQDKDLPSAFAQWLASPGHLGVLMDSRVSDMGVGLAPAGAQGHPLWLIVLLMTKRPR